MAVEFQDVFGLTNNVAQGLWRDEVLERIRYYIASNSQLITVLHTHETCPMYTTWELWDCNFYGYNVHYISPTDNNRSKPSMHELKCCTFMPCNTC